jgi:ATP-dependent DNA helicase PIF1
MLSIELFEKLEHLARSLRGNPRPFGGIQLIFSGDFLQLLTVGSDKFCFESPLWNVCIDRTIQLTEPMRQQDVEFSAVLSKIRMGHIDDDVKKMIESREIPYLKKTGLIPTMLYATNAKVDAANEKYYDKLKGHEYNYKISYTWTQNIYDKERFENMAKLPCELNLKVGAQVMHLVNIYFDDGRSLVNGSRGVVKSFIEGYPLVYFDNGMEIVVGPHCLDIEENDFVIMSYAQIPLRLAFAISAHRLCGNTVTLLRVDFSNFFADGQFYVALSRCLKLEGLYIRNLDWNRCFTNAKALKFYKDL